MVIACLVSDFDSKCRPTKLNMTETKVENVERWLHKRNVNKTTAEIVSYMMISRNHYI